MTTLAEALAPKSDQLNADDLIAGPRTLKITGARITRDDRQTKIVLNYEGDQGKPWKPCKTMGRAMVMAWGITDEAQMIGKSVRVYRDADVKFGDQGAVGGIRISHMSHIDKPAVVKLTVSQGKKGAFTFYPLVTDAPGITIDAARQAIADAPDMESLGAVWKSRSMAPFRGELQAVLDARKTELSGEGPADSQRGEAHANEDAESLIAMFQEATDEEAYNAAKKAFAVMRDGLDAEDIGRVEDAADTAATKVMA